MNKMTKDFITKLKSQKARDCKWVAKEVDKLLDAPSLDEVMKRLIAASRELDDNTLGYFVFPGLRREAATDESLPIKLQDLVQRRGVPANVRLHCIELIDKLFREKQTTYPTDYVDFICDTAVKKGIPVEVQARIARLLTRVKGQKQQETLSRLIDSKKAVLVEAACHTMSRWSKEKLRKNGKLLNQIMKLVMRSPAVANKNPNILRTLAQSNKRGVSNVIDKVIAETKNDRDWLRLAACIGTGSRTEQLAKIIEGVADNVRLLAKNTIRNLLKEAPHQLESLYKKGYYKAFVEIVAADPSAIGTATLSYLDRIELKADSKTRKIAKELKQELKSVRRNAFLPKMEVLNRKADSADSETQPPASKKIDNEFSTGFHMGDALYRDTYLTVPFTHNHWHSGIFQKFEFETNGSGIGSMQGVHMTGFPGDVQSFNAQLGFGDAKYNVADKMKDLYDAFLEAFFLNKSHDDYYYHGARRTPDMSKDDRTKLVDKSEELINQGIHYTFWDMLVQSGGNWDGTVSDIALLRCDGVVEYTYEACGKKVCVGKEVSKWNIAAPGNAYLDSHEDLHTWDLNAGELCPKVQAGNSGNDTTFIQPQPSVPIVQEFAVFEETAPSGNVIAIKLNSQSSEYYDLYVRIIVRKKNDPFYFAITESTSGATAQWMFRKVDEGTNHIAYWRGQTSGTNYSGNNGIYEFRALAVDYGGNVSEEYSSEITIDWSQLQP